MRVIVHTDGGSRGNPGPAATGVVIRAADGTVLASYGQYLGIQTNNYAEYSALLSALKKARELRATEVECVLDSELIVKQMNGQYKVKNPGLQKLFVAAYNAASHFTKVTYRHIRRAGNSAADAQVNAALDAAALLSGHGA